MKSTRKNEGNIAKVVHWFCSPISYT